MDRRKFLKTTGVVSGAGILTGFYTWQIEPHWLEIVKRKMPIKNLPENLVGRTLMQISDIHVGHLVSSSFLRNSLEKAAKLAPDFIVYTGDYIHYDKRKSFTELKEMAPFFPKGKLGTVGILGNHDFGESWAEPHVADTISEILEDFDIPILRNSVIDLEGLKVFGVDDFWGTNFRPENAMNKYSDQEPSLVLCHNPDVCDLDVWNGYQGWILSGHTHGGQVKPPFLDAPILPVENKRYGQGEIDLFDGRKLYINRALGHLYQVRFNVRPEITIFELEKEIS
ncbi:metallophosphoesterase [Croceivirga thetidis]|uniref:Phosphoesterase n=1 Tax=Croceivirga thetidis TaxID=2721623 RepID=A0ABX1GTK3_9FLAO|nr:metallophosphoesterase [Croceivirga thetidis]NKI33290.1 phosphoesterase [Croceivirga thetidis]